MNFSALFNPRPLMAMVVLTLVVLALALPGIRSMPVTDRDEARYAQASKQMVESGDYLQIRFLDEARNKKPAGIYWLQALSVQLTGVKDEIWPYRLVSVAGAWLLVLLVYLLARRCVPDAPLLPALALAACPLLVCVEHAATTDAVLAATVCAAQVCLARVYLGTREKMSGAGCQVLGGKGQVSSATCEVSSAAVQGSGFGALQGALDTRHSTLLSALGFWIALGVGMLVKGPITPLISGLTILALCLHDRDTRWLRALRPLAGFGLLLLMVLPWLVAIEYATHGDFLRESLGHDLGAKLQGGQEAHGAPPGVYLLAANFLFWPLFPLAWRGIRRAWLARRVDPVARFLLAWLLPAWLVFELTPTKLPHYVLPLYPALAFLAVYGWKMVGQSDGGTVGRLDGGTVGPLDGRTVQPSNRLPSFSWQARVWGGTCYVADAFWWLGAVLLLIGPILAGRLLGWAWMPAAFLCAAVAAVAVWLAWRQRPDRAVVVATGFALLFFGVLFTCVLPKLDDLWLTRKVAAMVAEQTAGKPGRVVSVGYSEPSMAFAFGTQTILTGGVERAVAELKQSPDTMVLVQDLPDLPPKLLPIGDDRWAQVCRMISVAPKNQEREHFLAAAARAGLSVREVAAVDGLNYSRTKRVRVILYHVRSVE